ncbi:hypothetical protein RJT34_01108 [Clitoria ternatea]|uniref:Fungal lipase-type domain-containing protein n=1 Tax=Clitoria ternatea TaxID=43366 RepID=A0AAN9Q0D8_CLITE
MELDRQKNRVGPNSLARSWWEFFHFQLHNHNVLVDSADSSIFGAIFELKLPSIYTKSSVLNAPKYVIVFRGTLLNLDTMSRDIHLDLKCMINTPHQSSRFKLAMHSIQNTVDTAGASNVWLAGHSLGSAIALLAGKNMAKMGFTLQTYLFNSPFTSSIFERIVHEKIQQRIHIAGSVMKAGLYAALKVYHHYHDDHDNKQDDPFSVLSTWVPYMFVNPDDHISSGYINYFAQRGEMEKFRAGIFEEIATKCTLESLVSCALDKKSEPFHLLLSAELIINNGKMPGFREAHGIRQWWAPHSQFQSLIYEYGN